MVDISIIIPAYNRLWCLPKAIASCTGNSCSVEIIVIDDGSTDGTLEWLNMQSGLIIIKQQHLGKCRAVNKGFEIARGKYIRFLDSDDMIDPGANDEQLSLGEKTNADIIVSGYKLFEEEGIFTKDQRWIETDDFIAQQLGECDSSHYSAYLFRKEFINEISHRPEFAFRDDRLFVLEAALKKPLIAIHPGTTLFHRIAHQDRLQVGSGLKQDVQNYQHLKIYQNILGSLAADKELTERRIAASLNVLWPLCTWIAKRHFDDAKQLYSWIVELKPDFVIKESGFKGVLYKKLGFSVTEKALSVIRFLRYEWK